MKKIKNLMYDYRNRMPVRKALEGIARFGVWNAMRGAVRLVRIRLSKSGIRSIQTARDEISISFHSPQELMPTLVLFAEITVSEIELVRKCLGKDSVFFDVGAGIGCYTLSAAKVAQAKVHSFEPSSRTYSTLLRNVAQNNVEESIVLNNLAVSDKSEKICMERLTDSNFSFSIVELGAVLSEEGEWVQSVTLDEYCESAGIKDISLLNVDVEGHDLAVLRGAEGLLRSGRILALMLEIHYSFQGVYEYVMSFGFKAYYFDGRRSAMIEVYPVTAESLTTARPSPFNRRVVFLPKTVAKEYCGFPIISSGVVH